MASGAREIELHLVPNSFFLIHPLSAYQNPASNGNWICVPSDSGRRLTTPRSLESSEEGQMCPHSDIRAASYGPARRHVVWDKLR